MSKNEEVNLLHTHSEGKTNITKRWEFCSIWIIHISQAVLIS